MPKTIRKQLIDAADSSLRALIRLDQNLMRMDLLADGRQPAITEIKSTLIEGHEALRVLWTELYNQL
jgi:hypothetical protein